MDNNSFTQMYNRLYSKIFSFVRLRISDEEEVKDIVSEVFLKAYKTWDSVYEEKKSLAYLYIIAKSKMIDHFRKASNRYKGYLNNKLDDNNFFDEFDLISGDEPLPIDIYEKNENREIALKLLNTLSPSEKQLMHLRYIEELEYKELSQIFKISEENIRQKVSRALQKLKKVEIKK